MRGALPLAAVLASRLNLDPSCAICGEKEDSAHLLFTCPFARACWYSGPLALRSDAVAQLMQLNYMTWLDTLSDDQWTCFANTAWAIWRCRNDRTYGGKLPDLPSFQRYLAGIASETRVSKSKRYINRVSEIAPIPPDSEFSCYSDGAWISEWKGGIGVIL